MSTTVDNKVVKMQFDNKQFEQGVSQSLSTLDKLKAALKFDKADTGIKNLGASINKTSFSGLENGILRVEARFSALNTIAFTVLQDMTRSAINAGKTIVNALAIEPVTTGFQEYETQMNAIQTILANTESKGSTLEDVNKALAELNTYADKTIYNFTEMTRNIGTFTAAGVGLETATKSIQGIANLAAISGSTSQQASTAMYQLSQALASGTVKLQDWNSVVNAGMGGEVFQTALKRTASAMGTNVDQLIEKYGSFRESLTRGNWLTTEILTNTLNQFAGVYSKAELLEQGYTEKQANDILKLAKTAEEAATKVKTVTQLWDTLKEAAQSGWTQSWQILVGDFEEAKTLLSGISDSVGAIINEQADMRNKLLRQAFGEHIIDSEKWSSTMKTMYGEHSKASQDWIKALTASAKQYDVNLAQMIQETGSFEEALDKGFLNKKVLEGALKFNKSLTDTAKDSKEAVKNQHALRDAVNGFLKSNKSGAEMLDGLSKKGYNSAQVLSNLAGKLRNAGTSLSDFSSDTKKVKGYTEEETKQLYKLKQALEKTDDPLTKLIWDMERPTGRTNVIEGFKNILLGLGDIIKAVGKAYGTVFDKLDASGVYDATKRFRDFTESLRLSKPAAERLTESLIPVFRILKTALGIFSLAGSAFGFLARSAMMLAQFLLICANRAGEFIMSIVQSSSVLSAFENLFGSISSAIKVFHDGFVRIIDSIIQIGSSLDDLPGVQKFISSIRELGTAFAAFSANTFANAIKFVTDLFASLVNTITGGSDDILKFFDDLGESASDFLSTFTGKSDGLDKKVDTLKIDETAKALDKKSSLLKKSSEYFSTARDILFESVSSFGKSLVDVLNQFDIQRLGDFINSGAFAVLILGLIRLMNAFKKLAKSGGKISKKLGNVLDEVSNTLQAYQRQINADALLTVAKAILFIAGALIALCFVPTDKLAAVTVDMTILLLAIAVVMRTLGKIGESSSPIAQGVDNLKGSLMNLVDGLKQTISKTAKVAAFGVFAVMLGAAITLIASAVIKLAGIPYMDAAVAILEVVAIALAIAMVGKLLQDHAKDLNAGMGVAVAGIGVAISLIADAAAKLGELKPEAFQQGMLAIIAILTLMMMITSVSGGNGMMGVGGGMILMAAGLTALLVPILAFAAVPWPMLAKGGIVLGVLAAGLAIIGVCAQEAWKGGVALLAFAAAITLLTPALLALGLAWPLAIAGILALAAALGVLLIAGTIAGIGMVTAGLLTLATTLPMIGVGLLAVGAGAALFGIGMLSAAMGVTVFAQALPLIANGIVAFAEIITANAPVVIRAVGMLILGVAAAIVAGGGAIGGAGVAALLGALAAVLAYWPQIESALGGMLDKLWNWISTKGPELIGNVINFIVTGMYAIGQGISDNAAAIWDAAWAIVEGLWNLLIEGLAGLAEKIPHFGKGLAEKVRGWKTEISKVTTKEEGKKVTEPLAEGMGEGAQGIPNMMSGIFGQTGNSITDAMNGWNIPTDTFAPMADATGVDMSNMTKYLEEAGVSVDSNTTSMLSSVKGNVGEMSNAANVNPFGNLLQNTSSSAEAIKTNVSDATGAVKQDINSIGDTEVKDPLAGLKSSFSGFDYSPVTVVRDKITSIMGILPQRFQATGQKSSKALSGSFNNISTTGLGTFATNVSSTLTKLDKTVANKSASINKSLSSATNIEANTSGVDKATQKIAKATESKSFAQSGKKAGTQFTGNIVTGINAGSPKVKSSTEKVAVAAANAFKSKTSTFTSIARHVMTQTADAIRSKRSSFVSAGTNCMSGVVSGLNSKLGEIRANAIKAANIWNSTYKSHQKISSPSKVTYKLGAWTMMGLVNAMNDHIKKVRKAASDTASTIQDTLSSPLEVASSLLDSDFSMAPVITPVVDMTNVDKSVSRINDSFGGRTLQLSAGIIGNARAAAAAQRFQNRYDNSEVVSAIDKLGQDINRLNGNTYNINGITYDDGSNIVSAVETLVRATVRGRRT